MLNHIIAKPIRKHLSRQRRDSNAGRFTLQNVAEVLEIAVPPTDAGVAQLEGRDVGAALDLVARVHVAADAVGFGVLDL